VLEHGPKRWLRGNPMSEPIHAGQARMPREVSSPEKADVLHQVRLCYLCLSCGDYIVEWREAPGHPIDCPSCREPIHRRGHE
jgi:rubrerythrin